MGRLNFNTGRITYTVNGNCEISFNPSDAEFAGKLFDAFSSFARRYEESEHEGTRHDPEDVFSALKERDKWMRTELDSLFGEPICEKIFGNMSVCALADGLPVWANFMLSVVDEIDKAITDEQKKTNPRVQKYLQKYNKQKAKR